jgi:hypothetical protein
MVERQLEISIGVGFFRFFVAVLTESNGRSPYPLEFIRALRSGMQSSVVRDDLTATPPLVDI